MTIEEFKEIVSKKPNSYIIENEHGIYAYKKINSGTQFGFYSKKDNKAYFSDFFWYEDTNQEGKLNFFCIQDNKKIFLGEYNE